MSSNTSNTRETLLGELESIKSLLTGDTDSSAAVNLPAVNLPPATAPAIDSTGEQQPAALPGQQGLFDHSTPGLAAAAQLLTESATIAALDSERQANVAHSENPFLPEHVRQRANVEQPGIEHPNIEQPNIEQPNVKRPLLDAIRQAAAASANTSAAIPASDGELAAAPKPTALTLSEHDIEREIDAVLSQFMPKIEAELRRRILQALRAQP